MTFKIPKAIFKLLAVRTEITNEYRVGVEGRKFLQPLVHPEKALTTKSCTILLLSVCTCYTNLIGVSIAKLSVLLKNTHSFLVVKFAFLQNNCDHREHLDTKQSGWTTWYHTAAAFLPLFNSFYGFISKLYHHLQ